MPEYIKSNIDLSQHCTFGVGGLAQYFVEVDTKEKLSEVFKWITTDNLKYFILGGGSNVLFSDKGFEGVIIRLINQELVGFGEDGLYLVEAGYSFPKFVSDMDRLGFFTAHWLGIPGTVGGAVAVNAGPGNGGSIGDDVVSALIFDIDTLEFKEVGGDWFEFEYRNTSIKSGKKKAIIWSFIISMHKKENLPADIAARYADHMKSKSDHQKNLGGRNAGCFFKNPQGDSAGRLIDISGLKGYKIGGAQISTAHANFIVNTGDATSKDILSLADLIKDTVWQNHQIRLEEEVVVA